LTPAEYSDELKSAFGNENFDKMRIEVNDSEDESKVVEV
jgi:hypothetical protein